MNQLRSSAPANAGGQSAAREGGSLASKTYEASAQNQQETADGYDGIVASLAPSWRVIECRDQIQWIAQRRKKGGAERPWRSLGFFRTREALMRFCANSCAHIDPAAWAALASLPERIGGAS